MTETNNFQTIISKNSKFTKTFGNDIKKKISNSLNDYLNLEILRPMIDKSVYIGEFKKMHKVHQNSFENRLVIKELYFIKSTQNIDIKLNKEINKVIISDSANIMFLIDINSTLLEVALESNTTRTIALINIYEKCTQLLDVEYNDSQRNFFLLNQNLMLNIFCHKTFCNVNNAELNFFEKLKNSKSRSIDLNNYLVDHLSNLTNTNSFETRSLMSYNQSNDSLIINLTNWSDRILMVNTVTLNVTHNIYINPLQFNFICNSSINQSFMLLVNLLIGHQWTTDELDEYHKVIKLIRTNPKSLHYLRIFSSFIYRLNQKEISYIERKNSLITLDLIYESVIILHTNSTSSFYNFGVIIERFEYYLNKLHNYSKLYEESVNCSQKIYYLIIRSLRRNIDIKKTLESFDKNKNYFVPFSEMNELLAMVPTGITKAELHVLYDEYKYDENNNVFYPFIFEKEDYEILKLINSNKHKKDKDKYYGYFKKESKKEGVEIKRKLPFRKYSDTGLFASNIDNLEKVTENIDINNNTSRLLGIKVQIEKYIFIPHLNIYVFTLSKEMKCSKLCLFKVNEDENVNSNQNKLKVELICLGFIETFSAESPSFLYFITERNLIVSNCKKINYENDYQHCFNFILEFESTKTLHHLQKVFKSIHSKESDGFHDVIFIDIYKDILDLFQVNKIWKIYRSKRIENLTKSNIKTFAFFPATKLFFVQSDEEIFILNPKSIRNELSIKYILEKETENVYDFVCRSLCENKSEFTGDSVFNIVKHIRIDKLNECRVLSYHNLIRNCKFDYLILLQKKTAKSKYFFNLAMKLTKIEISHLSLKVSAKNFDENVEEIQLVNKLLEKQKNLLLSRDLKIYLSQINKEDEDLGKNQRLILEIEERSSKTICLKTMKSFVVKSSISGEQKSELIRKSYDSFNSLFSLIKTKNNKINYITRILKNMNIHENILSFNESIKNHSPNIKGVELDFHPDSLEILNNFFRDIGVNQYIFFMKIVNNKFDIASSIPKTKLHNIISTKINSLNEKINISPIRFNGDVLSLFKDRIEFQQIKFLLNTDRLGTKKKEVTYSKENIDTIDRLLNKKDDRKSLEVMSSIALKDDVDLFKNRKLLPFIQRSRKLQEVFKKKESNLNHLIPILTQKRKM